jgi:hypothetical protein
MLLKVKIFLLFSVSFGAEAQLLIFNPFDRIFKALIPETLSSRNIIQNNQNNQIVYPQVSQSQACQGIYFLQQDYSGYFGLITIANPDLARNVLKVELSLAAALPNVRTERA